MKRRSSDDAVESEIRGRVKQKQIGCSELIPWSQNKNVAITAIEVLNPSGYLITYADLTMPPNEDSKQQSTFDEPLRDTQSRSQCK